MSLNTILTDFRLLHCWIPLHACKTNPDKCYTFSELAPYDFKKNVQLMFSIGLVARLKIRYLRCCCEGQNCVWPIPPFPTYAPASENGRGKSTLGVLREEINLRISLIWTYEYVLFLHTWGLLSYLGAAWHRGSFLCQFSFFLPNGVSPKSRKK